MRAPVKPLFDVKDVTTAACGCQRIRRGPWKLCAAHRQQLDSERRRPGLLSMAGLLCVLAACSGPGGDVGQAGAGGALAGGTGGAAGDAGADRAAPFVGTWSVVSGTLTLTCSNGYTSTSAVTSPDVFSRGVTSDLVLGGVCPVTFAISGTTAAASPGGQDCFDASTGTTTTLTAQTFTTADGRIGQEAGSARVAGLVDQATGQPVSCTVAESATYQKIAN
jgi:hypothetical protein